MIDSHLHLDGFERRGELAAMLQRAQAAGVSEFITVGTAPDDWDLYRQLAERYAGTVHHTVGLHPCSVETGWESAVEQIAGFWEQAQRPVALGECGLDRFHLPKDNPTEAERIFALQRGAFAAQLEIARRLAVPVVVHSRGAFRESVDLIAASRVDWSQIVFHCFVEGAAEMAELNGLGGRGSFTGILTYKTAEPVRAALKAQGPARVMVETDAPYLAPVPHRGKPCESAYVRFTAEAAAQGLGMPFAEFDAISTSNTRSFFRLPSL
jgi:TatD DNase family protein